MFLVILLFIINSSFAQSGTCGSTKIDCSWEFDNATGILLVVGNGTMDDYVLKYSPWYSLRKNISTVVIEGLMSIGNYAFAGFTSLESVTIPNTVTYFGEGAFYFCTKLKSFVMPESVTETGFMILMGCSSLENVTLSTNLQSLKDGFFYECTALQSINLENISILDYRVFYNCTSLRSIMFSNRLLLVGIETFAWCTSLETFFIPESVSLMGENAFIECNSLNTIVYGGLNAPTCQSDFSNLQFKVVVQDNYNSQTFCSKSVIKGFEGTCGDDCYWKVDSSMTHMKVNGSGFMDDFEDQQPWAVFTSILENVTIEGVTSIGSNAFSGFTSLKSISEGISTFGKNSLNGTAIGSIVIGNEESVFIGDNAFSNCENLQFVTIKPKFKFDLNDTSINSCSIQRNAFANCSNIELFIIDGYVNEVKEYAFDFNENNNVTFQYNSLSSPQICSSLDPNNNTVILPIFSKNASLINVPTNYQSTVFCSCDKLGCPIEYVENEEYDIIVNSSVPIEKSLNELLVESSSSQNNSNESSSIESGTDKSSVSQSNSKESESSETQTNSSNSDEKSEKSTDEESTDESSKSSKSEEDEDEAVSNAFLMTILIVMVIII